MVGVQIANRLDIALDKGFNVGIIKMVLTESSR